MLASDVITVARQNLDDTIDNDTSGYRFNETEMLNTLTSATRRLATDKPDLLVDTDGTIIAVVDVTATSQTLIFDRDWLESLSNYVCHLIFAKDSSDDYNANQSAIHKALYQSTIN
jgi:hypothetical protein